MTTPEETLRAYQKSALAADASRFTAQYRKMLDSQLLKLAAEREDLIPEAAAALDAELSLRKISVKVGGLEDENPTGNRERRCPLCGITIRLGWHVKVLYGQYVCTGCSRSLWMRRVLAHLIDDFVFVIVLPMIGIILLLRLGAMDWLGILFALMVLRYLFRDAKWLSVGKLMTGIEVIDTRNAKPAKFVGSLKRNLPLLIPFVPIVIAFQMQEGPRLGDGWAHTRVILKKYHDKELFNSTFGLSAP